MRKSIILFCIATILQVSIPLYSQEQITPPPIKINLAKAIDVALEDNFTLLKQKESNNIFKLRAKKEFTHLLPNLVAESEYAYNTRVGSVSLPGSSENFNVSKKNTANTSVSLIQPLTDLYKTSLNHKIAREKFNVSILNTERKNELIIDLVSKQYFNIIRQKRVINLNEQNISTLEAYYIVAKDHFDAGTALARDYMKVQIEIDNAKHRLLVEKNRLNVLLKQFKELLGISLDEKIKLSEDYSKKDLKDNSLEELQETALENRSEIKEVIKLLHIAKLNKKVKIADYIPHTSFFVSYVNQYGSEFYPDNNLMFGIRASYDFWQWNRKYLNIKEHQSEIKTKELELKELTRKISIEVESQLNKATEAKDLIRVSNNTVKLSKENLRITRDRYEIGLALVTDLLDDQTALLESQVKLVTSELDYQKSLIDLDKTTGTLIINN